MSFPHLCLMAFMRDGLSLSPSCQRCIFDTCVYRTCGNWSDVEIGHVQSIFLNEVAPWFDDIAHKLLENLAFFLRILNCYL